MSAETDFDWRIYVSGPVMLGGGPVKGHFDVLDCDKSHGDYVTNDGVAVWIERPVKGTRSAQKTRFIDAEGNQHGPIHANFAPAIVWAANEGWRSPGAPDWFNDGVTAEVRAGGCPKGAWPDEPRGEGGVS